MFVNRFFALEKKMKIQVVGPGSINCTQLAENVACAAKELGIECQVEMVTGKNQIAHLGVTIPPALIIEGEVRSVGRVSSRGELRSLLNYLKKSLKI